MKKTTKHNKAYNSVIKYINFNFKADTDSSKVEDIKGLLLGTTVAQLEQIITEQQQTIVEKNITINEQNKQINETVVKVVDINGEEV